MLTPEGIEGRPDMSKIGRLAGYGIGDFGLNIYWNTLSIWLIFWYTSVVGVSPELAGTLFFIGMAWDAISDPIIASVSERVRTRHGTYRPFLLYGSFGLGISFIILFWVPPFEGALLIVSLVLAGILFRTAYTLVAIPYAAMSSRITYDSVERTEFTGVRMFFAFLGLLFISNQLPPLARWLSGGDAFTAGGFQSSIMIFGAIATVALLICFWGTREKPLPKQTVVAKLRAGDIVHAFLNNRALLILLGVVVLQSGATACLSISMVFFIVSNQDIFASKEAVLTAYALATITGVPLWTLFIRRFGKKVAWVMSSILVTFAGLHMLSFGPLVFHGIPLQILVFGFSVASYGVLLWSFVPDTVEYGQDAAGVRAEGVVFGSVLVVQKLSGGFMGFIVGVVIGAIGYDADLANQSSETAKSLTLFLAICPATLLFLSIFPIWKLPLNREVHADIVDRLSSDKASVGTREPQ